MFKLLDFSCNLGSIFSPLIRTIKILLEEIILVYTIEWTLIKADNVFSSHQYHNVTPKWILVYNVCMWSPLRTLIGKLKLTVTCFWMVMTDKSVDIIMTRVSDGSYYRNPWDVSPQSMGWHHWLVSNLLKLRVDTSTWACNTICL